MTREPLVLSLLLACSIVLTASLPQPQLPQLPQLPQPQLPAHSRTKRAACGDCAHFWSNPLVVAACYAGCELCGPSVEKCGGGEGGGSAEIADNGIQGDGSNSRWGPGGGQYF